MERQLHFERQRVAALSGVQPPQAPVSREEQEIRQQLEQLYPGLGKLGGMMEKLERLAALDPQDLTGAQTHYWESIGHQTLSRLDDEVAELVGGELSPFQRQAMRSAFGAWIQSDQTLGARYAQMDPKLVKDFIKEYQQGFVDPVRRSFTTQQAPRQERAARLPRGGNSSAIPGGGPAQIQPADTDEFHGAAFRALTQSRQ
jgi:hypothetical protein